MALPIGVLGCAEEYSARILGPDYRTPVENGELRFSSLEWNRVLDDISNASVVVPDHLGGVRCCAQLNGLVPWRYGLAIERNATEVWRGPIIGLRRNQGELPALTISAADIFARLTRRLAARTQVYSFRNADSGVIFSTLINEAAPVASDQFTLVCPTFYTGQLMSRDVRPLDFEYSWDVLRDLLQHSVDAHVLDGIIHVWAPGAGWVQYTHEFGVPANTTDIVQATYLPNREMVFRTFTDQSWSEPPEWTIDGYQQGNSVWLPASDQGEDGSRRWWRAEYPQGQYDSGVLDYIVTSTLYRGQSEGQQMEDSLFQRAADTALALRAIAPAIIEGGALSALAPVPAHLLYPGSIWEIDIDDACFGQLLQRARLKRVQVTVTASDQGLTERVSPTLQPPGQED